VPVQGRGFYYDIVETDATSHGDVDGPDLTAAVWYYPDPFPAVASIQGHVAFYADRVTITTFPSESTV